MVVVGRQKSSLALEVGEVSLPTRSALGCSSSRGLEDDGGSIALASGREEDGCCLAGVFKGDHPGGKRMC